VTPADFVASIADVAAGRNRPWRRPASFWKIEFRLAVGTETKGGGRIEISCSTPSGRECDRDLFLQELTLEIRNRARAARPSRSSRGAQFVEAAMNTARDLARTTTAAGLPRRSSVPAS
jgi:hypothetical protein